MFDILTALFGGAFLGGASLLSARRKNERAREQQTYEAKVKAWENRLCLPYAEEKSIKEYIMSGLHTEEIFNQFEEYFKQIFGLNYRNHIRLPNAFYKPNIESPTEHSYWVYHLILASKGKMDHWILVDGFPVSSADLGNRFVRAQFVRCIDIELRKFHPDAMLGEVTGESGFKGRYMLQDISLIQTRRPIEWDDKPRVKSEPVILTDQERLEKYYEARQSFSNGMLKGFVGIIVSILIFLGLSAAIISGDYETEAGALFAACFILFLLVVLGFVIFLNASDINSFSNFLEKLNEEHKELLQAEEERIRNAPAYQKRMKRLGLIKRCVFFTIILVCIVWLGYEIYHEYHASQNTEAADQSAQVVLINQLDDDGYYIC